MKLLSKKEFQDLTREGQIAFISRFSGSGSGKDRIITELLDFYLKLLD